MIGKVENAIKSTYHYMIEAAGNFALRFVGAVILLLIGMKVIRALVKMTGKALERGNVEKGVATFLKSLVRYLLYFVLILVVLAQFGVTTGSVVAVLGSAGLTLGLALQGSLANFAGGVLILILKPFVVGDYICTKEEEGTVESITIFYTRLVTAENHSVVIPNGTLSNNTITNLSRLETRRVDIKISVDYSSDLAAAKKALEQIAAADEAVLKDKGISVFVSELAESGVDLELRAWVKNADYWPAKWRLTEAAKNAMDENGIGIPYPHIQLVSQTDKNDQK